MQVDKFLLSTLLSGYYLSTCIFHSNNSNWGHSTSMLHTSPSVRNLYMQLTNLIESLYLEQFMVYLCIVVQIYEQKRHTHTHNSSMSNL